jgi:hypothetical protein
MPLIVQQIIGGLIRLALVPVVGWLVAHGVIRADQDVQVYAEVTAYGLGAIWVVYNAVKRMRWFNTAAGSSTVSTPQEIIDQEKAGTFASALTPKNEVPVVKDNS